MYPSSTSSSSQNTTGPSSSRSLERYGSAPSSLFTNAVDSISATREFSVLGGVPTHQPHLATARFFPSESNSESTTMSNQNENVSRNNNHGRESREDHHHSSKANTTIGLQRNYGFLHTGGGGASSSSPLVRHSSSPAGFLNQLASAAASDNNGFSISKGMGSYSNNKGVPDNSGRDISRLSSQLSFTRGQEPLSRIYEESETGTDAGRPNANDHSNGHRKQTQSYPNTGFSMGPWDDSNATMFAVGTSKRAKNGHNGMEPHQFQFSIPQAALEMASMETLLHIPQDSVPCKIRAKRGFATHPRSIAERERRTRISGKLKKLQDLVPNMDKQTSYSDMLDLAVQHIKSLQHQLQKLNKDLDNCTCGCKKDAAENS